MTDPYDDRLPILAELEREIGRAAAARLQARPAESARRRLWRIPRRTALLGALACLVSATATATVISTRSDSDSRTRDVLVSRSPGRDGYSFSLHEVGSRVCTAFVLRQSLDTVCVPPPRRDGDVLVRSALGPFTRYVYGLTLATTLELRVGDERRRIDTRALPTRDARVLRVANGQRFFVVAMRRAREGENPVAVVRVRGRAGLGREHVDCSLGQFDSRCRPG